MTYYFSKSTQMNFDETIFAVKEKLSAEGFGILSEIDVKSKMKEKLNIDFRNYTILGAASVTEKKGMVKAPLPPV